MALVLVRLRLALARHGTGRSGGSERAWFMASWALGLVLGLATGAVVAELESSRSGPGDVGVVALLTIVWLGWVVLPVVLPALADTTVDPARLEQFPLRRREQVVGLTAGSLLAPTAVFTLLAAAGGTVASGESWSARLAVLTSALLFTVLCVLSSRAVQALLAGALRSRRGRDAVAVLSSLVALGIWFVARSSRDAVAGLEDPSGPLVAAMSWFPPGAAARASLDARDGDWASSGAHLAVVVAAGLALALLWAWALERRLDGGTSRGRVRPEGDPAAPRPALLPRALPSTSPGPAVAAAAQQLRYLFFRSPRAVQAVALPVVLGAVLGHSTVGEGGLMVGVILFTLLCGTASCFALLGHDGPGFGYLLLAGPPWRAVLAGKASASLLYLVPLTAVFALVEGAVHGDLENAPAALLAGTAVLLAAAGVGAVGSVRSPVDQTAPGRRRAGVVAVLGWYALFFVVVGVGALFGAALAESVPVTWVVTGAVLVALVAALLLVDAAGRRLARDPWRVAARLGARIP